jgi:hypothetical protein
LGDGILAINAMLVFQIIYASFCIVLAYFNAYLIKKGKHIYHFWNGLLHIAAAVAGIYFFNWQTGFAILFIARVFFDWSLSIFRGLPLAYVSPKPLSKVDQIEKSIFGLNGILPKIIYIVFIVVLNII